MNLPKSFPYGGKTRETYIDKLKQQIKQQQDNRKRILKPESTSRADKISVSAALPK